MIHPSGRGNAEPAYSEGEAAMKKIIAGLLVISVLLLCGGAAAEQSEGPGCTLDRVVILSRHNIRSPLSGRRGGCALVCRVNRQAPLLAPLRLPP